MNRSSRHGLALALALMASAVAAAVEAAGAPGPKLRPAPGPAAARSWGGQAPLPLRSLGRKRARELRKLLAAPFFSVFGEWRSNETFLQELNSKLQAGQLALIDGFLAADVAEALQRDAVRASAPTLGWLRKLGSDSRAETVWPWPWAKTEKTEESELADVSVHDDSPRGIGNVSGLCEVLSAQEAKEGFRFRFHVLDPRGKHKGGGSRGHSPSAAEFPGHMRLLSALAQEAWSEALLLLTTGSARAAKAKALEFDPPYLRELLPGDFATLHNDLGGRGVVRLLCLNYWLPLLPGPPSTHWSLSPWPLSQGGGFVWCGARGPGVPSFPTATIVPPNFNRAGLFVPGPGTWHAVQPLAEAASETGRRFSWTSWLAIAPGSSAEL